MAFTQQTKVVKIHLRKTKVVRIHLRKTRRTCLEKICSPDISVHILQNLSITILSPRDRKPTRQSYKYCAQTKEMYVFSPTRITFRISHSLERRSAFAPSPARPKETPRGNNLPTKEEKDQHVNNCTTPSDRAWTPSLHSGTECKKITRH